MLSLFLMCGTAFPQIAAWDFTAPAVAVKDSAGGIILSVKSAAWSAGLAGKALDAEKGAYAVTSEAAALDITGALTVEALVKRTSDAANGSSGWVGIMSKGGYQKGYQLVYHQPSKRVAFCVNTDGGGYKIVWGKDLVLGEWMHIAAVYNNQENRMRIYLNGALSAEAEQTGRISQFSREAYIGKGQESACFNGSLQMVTVYDRSFSLEEAKARTESVRSGVTAAKHTVSASTGTFTLSLASAAVMGLSDETAEDQKGGWTDQGKGNDLSALPTGTNTYGNVPFHIEAGDKACIMLQGPKRPYFPEKALLPVQHNIQARFIFLLHATAFTPGGSVDIGRIVPVYADGEGAAIPVVRGRDVADWWGAHTIENGYAGFKTDTISGNVGLFVSKFPIDGTRSIQGIRFESANTAVWGIAGVTLSGGDIPFPVKQAYTIAESKTWPAIAIDKAVVPGSALDFSGILDAPAGKYGFLTTNRDGRWVFEKDTRPMRFSGTHIATFSGDFLTPLSHDELTQLAENVARMGYNSVRFQYIDTFFFNDRDDHSSINAAHVAAFDYLLAQLKKLGVYTTIDLAWSRFPKALLARHFPGSPANPREYYTAAFYIVPELREDLKQHARALLEHINPFTGFAWKDDPALLYVDLVNEDPLDYYFGRIKEVHALYEKEFNVYLKERYRSTQELASAWGGLGAAESLERGMVRLPKAIESDKRAADVCRFLSGLQAAGYREMTAYLHGIGVRQPITACNMVGSRYTALVRSSLEVADQHGYWDHPKALKGGWSLPYAFKNTSAAGPLQWPLGVQKNMAAFFSLSRIAGKPFIVSEYNFVLPNMYRSETGLYMGTIAALQGWDGLWHMGYAAGRDDVFSNNTMKGFMSASDPVSQAFERQVKMLYLRGDVREAPGEVRFFAKPDDLCERWDIDAEAVLLSFITRVCLDIGESPRPGGHILPLRKDMGYSFPESLPVAAANDPSAAGHWLTGLKGTVLPEQNKSDPGKGLLETATREARFNFTEGTIAVNTKHTKAWAVKRKGRYDLPGIFAVIDAGACSLSFSSLDGKPLAESTRILIMFPTDAVNRNMQFESDDRTVLTAWGETPVLFRAGTAAVTMQHSAGLKLFALSTAGRRIAEVPVTYTGGSADFIISHAQKGTAVLYWELAEK